MSKIVTNQISTRGGKNLSIEGSVTSSTGTFSSNVSVGGTLTYDDITNVQSTGIVTARTGIDVISNGIDAIGVITATSFSGDGSQLEGLESGVSNFVASGNITNGATVIIKDDGTVGIVTGNSIYNPSISSPTTFHNDNTNWTSVVYDTSNNKVIIAYQDEGDFDQGKVTIGTVSGSSINFGSDHIFSTSHTEYTYMTYDPTAQKIVIQYSDVDNSNHGKCIVGTVDAVNDNVTFGAPNTFNSDTTYPQDICYDIDENKVIIFYIDPNNTSYKGKSRVGTVAGTGASATITFGSVQDIYQDTTGTIAYIRGTYLPNVHKLGVSFSLDDSNGYGFSKVGTVNGVNNTISYGSATQFSTGKVLYTRQVYDSTSGKVILFYRDLSGPSSSTPGYARVGTVNGNSIGFGSTAITSYVSGSIVEPYHFGPVYLTNEQKILLAYQNRNDSSHGYWALGTVSGTSISFGNGTEYSDGASIMNNALVYNPDQQNAVITYVDRTNNSDIGAAVVFSYASTNLTTENYIGIAAEAISNGATGKVNIIGGVNTSQTGLTTAQTYYVQRDGTLATTADNPSVVAGTSISSTNLVLR